MNKVLIISSFSFLLSFSSLAQDSIKVFKRHIETELNFGYIRADFSSINAYLQNNGLNTISNNRTMLGVSFLSTPNYAYKTNADSPKRKIVHGVTFDMLLPYSESQPGNRETRLTGFSLGYLFGYAIIQKQTTRLYIYFNQRLGNSYSLKIIDTQTLTNANDVVNLPNRNASLDYNYLYGMYDIGLSLNKYLPLKNQPWDGLQRERFLILSIKTGYRITNESSDYKLKYNGQSLVGSPTLGLNGFYVRLSIGFGSSQRQVKWK